MTAETTKAAPTRPTPERMRKGDIIEAKEERGTRPKPWQSVESAHDAFLASGIITRRGWEAANDFQKTYYLANGSGMAAASFEPAVDGGGRDVSERQANAKLRIARWSRDLAPMLFSVLEGVLGLGKSPSAWARDIGEHPSAGRVVLVAAIEQFALKA